MEEALGKYLTRTRESAGITVDDAVYIAKIPRGVVEALEAEDFGFFTSPLYARSFLRQYSEYIGADVEFWIDSFVPATMIEGETVEAMIDISEPVAKAVTRQQAKTSSGHLAAVWMVMITTGLVWGGVEVYKKMDSQLSDNVADTAEPIAKPDVQPSPEPNEPVESLQAEETVTSSPPEPPRRAIIVNVPEAIPEVTEE